MDNLSWFLEELGKTSDWHIANGNIQRYRRGDIPQHLILECPITAVANMRGYGYSMSESWLAAGDIGLAPGLAGSMIRAADCAGSRSPYEQELRLRLLQACGLTEG